MFTKRLSQVGCSVQAPNIQRLEISLPACNSQDPQELAIQAICRSRAVKALHMSGGATDNELLQTKLYRNHCLSKAAAIGPYAHPSHDQLVELIESVTTDIALMKGDIKDLINQISSMGADIKSLIDHTDQSSKIVDERLAAIEARQRNAAAVDGADALCPVPHRGKPAPASFPASRDILRAMTVANLDLLLAYYELDVVGNAPEKRRRLSLHLGMVLRQVDKV
jgi:hypothetical protein